MGRRLEYGPMGTGAVTAAGGGSVSDLADLIASLTRQVADFPTAGIQFKDLTPVFADRRGLAAVTDALADVASGADLIAGIDARGFLIGGALAVRLDTGVLAIRKGGKLPPPVFGTEYRLEYGTARPGPPRRGHRPDWSQHCDRGRRAGHRGLAGGRASVARAGRRAGDDG